MRNVDTDWSQKYRPQTIGEVILPAHIKSQIVNIVNSGGGMSLLFHGRAGCGKTTVAKLINPENTLPINCTADNSIDMVRKLRNTCSSLTVYGDRRLILFDEADYLTKDAQAALRGVTEELSITNDFIMTANDKTRLSEPIMSRFYPVHFDFLLTETIRNEMAKRLMHIAHKEGYAELKIAYVNSIIKQNFPDMRKMVKQLQFELKSNTAVSH